MQDDYKPILVSTGQEQSEMNLYFLHDVHIGSSMHSTAKLNAFINLVKRDEYAKVLVIGDLCENVVVGSKGDIFYQVLSPHEQKYRAAELLKDLNREGKILAVVPGNHERNRITRLTSMFPLYDACVIAGCEDVYRQHFAFVDVGIGYSEHKRDKSKGKQQHYVGYITHHAKDQVQFCTADTIDGIDFFAYGHDHQPKDKPRGKLCYDAKNKTIKRKNVEVVNCGSMMDYGGYAVDSAHRIPAEKMYMLKLLDQGRGMETRGFYL